MITRLLIVSLALVFALGSSACRSSRKIKTENKPVAEMEANFKNRWIEKRVNELVNGGTAPDAARTQATNEFSQLFIYTGGLKAK